MSGVSITSGGTNIDFDAIVAGGDTFVARVKELQAIQAKLDASYAALSIGKDATAVLQEAQLREQQATKLVSDATEQAAEIIAKANSQAAEIIKSAQDGAGSATNDAQAKINALDAQAKDAQQVLSAWSAQTKSEAGNIMASAVSVKAAADKHLADNQAAAKDLADKHVKADAALQEANRKQAALDAKLNAIKVAAS